MPTSYFLQQRLISVGSVFHHGGVTEVSRGEYLGFSVAIKRFKMNEGDSDRIFKVPLVDLCALPLLSFYPAIMPRGHRLETSVPSKHLPFVGDFYVRGFTPFSHSFQMDVQRERDAICKI